MQINRIPIKSILFIIGLFIIFFAIFRLWKYPAVYAGLVDKIETIQDSFTTLDSSSQVITLKINGMTCTGCERTVKKALAEISGVKKVRIRHELSQAKVTVDPKEVSLRILIEAVSKAGYSASVKKP